MLYCGETSPEATGRLSTVELLHNERKETAKGKNGRKKSHKKIVKKVEKIIKIHKSSRPPQSHSVYIFLVEKKKNLISIHPHEILNEYKECRASQFIAS